MRSLSSVDILLVLFFSLGLSTAEAKTLSRVVGAIGDNYLTSRECEAMQYLEKVTSDGKEVAVLPLNSSGFDRAVTGVLLERIIASEAEDFSVANISSVEVDSALAQVKNKLSKDEGWKKLDVQESELRAWLGTKLRSKKFIKYKTESASIPITDAEAKDYFDKNRHKFGSLPFSNFKENIKSFLAKQQLENSLKEWFEILNRKYRLRNFESESSVAQ